MDEPTEDAIHDLTPSGRRVLASEVQRELGRCGIYVGHAWIDAEALLKKVDSRRSGPRASSWS